MFFLFFVESWQPVGKHGGAERPLPKSWELLGGVGYRLWELSPQYLQIQEGVHILQTNIIGE
jgi:hypothetical protein